MEQRHRTPRIRIAIVDRHPIFRDALKRLFELEPDFNVVGEGASTVDALRIVSATRPDVLLLDVAPPKVDGLAVLARFPQATTRVILLAAAIGEDDVVRALQLGARGVILKGSTTRFLIDGIRAVRDGRYVVGSDVIENLAHVLSTTRAQVRTPFGLTPREFEISVTVAAGATNREVAQNLSISIQTVKHHLTNIFEKTRVSTRLELMVFAINHDFISGRRSPVPEHAKEAPR